MARKNYTNEFRQRAVDLFESTPVHQTPSLIRFDFD